MRDYSRSQSGKKKGYKKTSDKVKKKQIKEENIDLFDYDWLDEE